MTPPLPFAPGARDNLLLIEDDDGVRRSLQLVLSGLGFDVRSFATATPALADPASTRAPVLLVSNLLPDLDAAAVLSALAARGWSGTAIMLASDSSDALRDSARSAGFASVIRKPVRQQELLSALAR